MNPCVCVCVRQWVWVGVPAAGRTLFWAVNWQPSPRPTVHPWQQTTTCYGENTTFYRSIYNKRIHTVFGDSWVSFLVYKILPRYIISLCIYKSYLDNLTPRFSVTGGHDCDGQPGVLPAQGQPWCLASQVEAGTLSRHLHHCQVGQNLAIIHLLSLKATHTLMSVCLCVCIILYCWLGVCGVLYGYFRATMI